MCVELKNVLEIDVELQNEIRNWRNSEGVSSNLVVENITDEQHKGWLENLKNKDKILAFIIYYEKQAVGCTFLKNIDKNLERAEFGIFIIKDFWGRGIASKALNLMLEIGFKKLNLTEIYLEVMDNNIKAKNIYLKRGFIEDFSFNKVITKGGSEIRLSRMFIRGK